MITEKHLKEKIKSNNRTMEYIKEENEKYEKMLKEIEELNKTKSGRKKQ